MRLVYMSDDGRIHMGAAIQGSDKAVQEYEEKQRDPLAKIRLPWRVEGSWLKNSDNAIIGSVQGRATEGRAFVAFANLAPLIKAWRALKNDPARVGWHPTALALIEAYDKAEELAEKL